MLWNYRDEVTAEERASIEVELESLVSKVPTLKELRWGPVVGGLNQSFSHCFVMLFNDKSGLEEYGAHPDHAKFSARFREACSVQVVVDYDSGDLR